MLGLANNADLAYVIYILQAFAERLKKEAGIPKPTLDAMLSSYAEPIATPDSKGNGGELSFSNGSHELPEAMGNVLQSLFEAVENNQ